MDDVKVNDIIAYRVFTDHITVHRVMERFCTDGELSFNTKGDNNLQNDDYIVRSENYIGIVWLPDDK